MQSSGRINYPRKKNNAKMKKMMKFLILFSFICLLSWIIYYKFFVMTIPVSYEISGKGLLDNLQYSVPGVGIRQAEAYERSSIKIHFYIANNKTANFMFKSRILRSTGLTLKIYVKDKVFYSETTDTAFNVDLKYNPQQDR